MLVTTFGMEAAPQDLARRHCSGRSRQTLYFCPCTPALVRVGVISVPLPSWLQLLCGQGRADLVVMGVLHRKLGGDAVTRKRVAAFGKTEFLW